MKHMWPSLLLSFRVLMAVKQLLLLQVFYILTFVYVRKVIKLQSECSSGYRQCAFFANSLSVTCLFPLRTTDGRRLERPKDDQDHSDPSLLFCSYLPHLWTSM